jgi:osmotically-inducible protein OsmY
MKGIFHSLASLVMAGVLTASLAAQTDASRYDPAIQAKVALELAKKPEFRNVQSSTEDGIVTLTGTVELYQQKLDAAKKIRKSDKVQGVRNLIEVSSTVPMANSRRSSTASSTMTALAMTIFSTSLPFLYKAA